MKLSTDIQDGHLIVTVHTDKLDAAGAIQFREKVNELQFDEGLPTILDLTKICFMDSSGVWALTHFSKSVQDRTAVKLVTEHLTILRLLRATGIARFIDTHPTVAAAVAPQIVQPTRSTFNAMLRLIMRPLRRFNNRGTASSQTA